MGGRRRVRGDHGGGLGTVRTNGDVMNRTGGMGGRLLRTQGQRMSLTADTLRWGNIPQLLEIQTRLGREILA